MSAGGPSLMCLQKTRGSAWRHAAASSSDRALRTVLRGDESPDIKALRLRSAQLSKLEHMRQPGPKPLPPIRRGCSRSEPRRRRRRGVSPIGPQDPREGRRRRRCAGELGPVSRRRRPALTCGRGSRFNLGRRLRRGLLRALLSDSEAGSFGSWTTKARVRSGTIRSAVPEMSASSVSCKLSRWMLIQGALACSARSRSGCCESLGT
eukprot:767746-Hanusia_phi.AAC.2